MRGKIDFSDIQIDPFVEKTQTTVVCPVSETATIKNHIDINKYTYTRLHVTEIDENNSKVVFETEGISYSSDLV